MNYQYSLQTSLPLSLPSPLPPPLPLSGSLLTTPPPPPPLYPYALFHTQQAVFSQFFLFSIRELVIGFSVGQKSKFTILQRPQLIIFTETCKALKMAKHFPQTFKDHRNPGFGNSDDPKSRTRQWKMDKPTQLIQSWFLSFLNYPTSPARLSKIHHPKSQQGCGNFADPTCLTWL